MFDFTASVMSTEGEAVIFLLLFDGPFGVPLPTMLLSELH